MKCLLPLPLPYDGTEARYVARDGARFCAFLREHGVEAVKLLVDDGRGFPPPKSPLLGIATWEQWRSPEYWRSQRVDFVLLYGGFSRQLEPVASAIRSIGVPVALKMDSASGLLAFPDGLPRLLRTGYFAARQIHGPLQSLLLSARQQIIRASGVNNRFLSRYLSLFDVITAEHPFARDNTRTWLRRRGMADIAERVHVLHHPVPDGFVYTGEPPKRRQILAVAADWRNPLKGGSLLARILARTLLRLPTYEALVIGRGSDTVIGEAARYAPTVAGRLRALPLQPAAETCPFYSASRVLLITSGSEGAPNVATEAACCGCSVVFPPDLCQLSFLTAGGSGRMAPARRATAMADACVAESAAWDRGERDPAALSALWGQRLHTSHESRRLLGLFGLELPD